MQLASLHAWVPNAAQSLRGRLASLLVLAMVLMGVLLSLLVLWGGANLLQRQNDDNLLQARQLIARSLTERELALHRNLALSALDSELRSTLLRLSGADAIADKELVLAQLAKRIPGISLSADANVIVYDADGTPMLGSSPKGRLHTEHEILQPLWRFSRGSEGAAWRVRDGQPVLLVWAPVRDLAARHPQRLAYLAMAVAVPLEEIRQSAHLPEMSLDWVQLDGPIASAGNAVLPRGTMRKVPFKPAQDWERLPAGTGRFEVAGYTVQLMRFPGRADEALILALSLPRVGWGGATVRPLLFMLGLGAVASAAVLLLMMFLARRSIVSPVTRLMNRAFQLRQSGAASPRAALHGGELEDAEQVLDDLAQDWQKHIRETDLWSAVFEKTREAIFVTDTAGVVIFANQALADVTGRPIEDVLGNLPNFLRANLHEESFYDNVWHSLRKEGHWSGEVMDSRSDGTAYPQWLSMTAISDRDGVTSHYVGIFSDISERKAQEARIHFLAHHDALTGLPNRTLLLERLGLALANAERDGHKLALLFIDLDRFKYINDTLGHTTGDGLLQAVAERLRRAVRAIDTVSRLGGDEFIVLLSQLSDEAEAAQVAEHILAVLAPVARVGGHNLSITPSIGISLYPQDARDADDLIRNADVAMYHAKAQGRNNFQRFRLNMTEAAAEHLSLEHSLRQAVDHDEFALHYQPQIDIATRRLTGVEALIRWQSPEYGAVSPAKFIPIAEECGLILQIGDWVMREACRQRAQWNQQGLIAFPVAVNVSALQFRQPDFARRVKDAMQLYGVSAKDLELELTESIVMHEADTTSRTLASLRALGIAMSIDDFGTGYSSLGYLKRLPIEKLKIDASFVRDLETDSADRAIVEAIVSLGRALGLRLVAEGVENRSTLGVLSKLGCHTAQGYYYCRPIPAAEFETWLSNFSAATGGGSVLRAEPAPALVPPKLRTQSDRG